MQRNTIPKVDSSFVLNTNRKNAVSELTKDYRAEVRLLRISDLKPYRFQARKTFNEDEIKSLANTIEKHGIRNPLTVFFDSKEDKYEIISGERRFRAAQLLNLRTVPCIVLDNGDSAQEIALIENIQRKDLHPVELLEGIENFINSFPDISKEELYKRLGLSKSYFYKILKLANLTTNIRDIVLAEQIVGERLYTLAEVPQDDQQAFIDKPKLTGNAGAALNRAMNKKSRVLQMSIKEDKLDIETNLHVLSKAKKAEAILLLKKLLEKIESELRD